MSKSKTKKAGPKVGTKALAKAAADAIGKSSAPKTPREELCVFAFRLTTEERDAIHKAAGPAKASKFVRTLAVAAARNDEAAVKAILKGIQTDA